MKNFNQAATSATNVVTENWEAISQQEDINKVLEAIADMSSAVFHLNDHDSDNLLNLVERTYYNAAW